MTHRSLDLAQTHVHATLPTCRYIQKHPLPHAPHHLRSRITKLPSSPVPADPKIPHVPPSGPLQPAHRHLSSALLPTTTLISSYTLLCLVRSLFPREPHFPMLVFPPKHHHSILAMPDLPPAPFLTTNTNTTALFLALFPPHTTTTPAYPPSTLVQPHPTHPS